jgi:hypothetical protein
MHTQKTFPAAVCGWFTWQKVLVHAGEVKVIGEQHEHLGRTHRNVRVHQVQTDLCGSISKERIQAQNRNGTWIQVGSVHDVHTDQPVTTANHK